MAPYLSFQLAALFQRKEDSMLLTSLLGPDYMLQQKIWDLRIYIVIYANFETTLRLAPCKFQRKKGHRNGRISSSIEQANTSSKQPLPSMKDAC